MGPVYREYPIEAESNNYRQIGCDPDLDTDTASYGARFFFTLKKYLIQVKSFLTEYKILDLGNLVSRGCCKIIVLRILKFYLRPSSFYLV